MIYTYIMHIYVYYIYTHTNSSSLGVTSAAWGGRGGDHTKYTKYSLNLSIYVFILFYLYISIHI